jgi:hypothetical protein
MWDMKKVLNVIAVLLMSGIVAASSPPGDSDAHSSAVYAPLPGVASTYWSRTNIALVAVDALAKSVDEAFTMRNAGRPNFEEHDPLARPFVTHGRAIAGTSQGLLFAGEVFTSYELHKHGHGKIAKAVLLLGIGGNTVGIATSTR